MSRSGLTEDDGDSWTHIRWRGMVASAARGARGQRMLRDLLASLDAMPVKELVTGKLRQKDGNVCALGAVMETRGVDPAKFDVPEGEEDDYEESHDFYALGLALDVAPCLAQEVVWENDEVGSGDRVRRTCGVCHGWGEIPGRHGPCDCYRCTDGFVTVYLDETPARRWTRVRAWVEARIRGDES